MSRIYIDSNLLIYLLDSVGPLQVRAARRLAALSSGGDRPMVSWLVRLECRLGPLKRSDLRTVADFDTFFASPTLEWAAMTEAVYDRAAHISAGSGLKVQDSLHLAAAVEAGCGSFLTNDAALARFTGLPVEVLP